LKIVEATYRSGSERERDAQDLSILDAVREVRPPFSPESVVEEFVGLLPNYRIATVVGDRYGGEWPAERFREHGIEYRPAQESASDLYIELLPLLNSRKIELLDHPRLTAQLCALERKAGRTGKDLISHPPMLHDDVVNAVAGLFGDRPPPGVFHHRRNGGGGPASVGAAAMVMIFMQIKGGVRG